MNEKFLSRGKREDTKAWIEGYYVKIPNQADKLNKEYHIIFELDGQVNYVIPETVGSCTSLTDKNGVLIFEGDIVKTKRSSRTVIGIVKYDTNLASFALEESKYYLYFNDDFFCDNCEVIGNIHDNAEMLSRADMPVSNDVFQPVLKSATPENFEIMND